MTGREVFSWLIVQGFRLQSAPDGSLVVRPARLLTSEVRDLIRSHKAALLVELAQRCPAGHVLDGRGRCWLCFWRRCPCGLPTGSAFLALCSACGVEDDRRERETAEPAGPWVAYHREKSRDRWAAKLERPTRAECIDAALALGLGGDWRHEPKGGG